MRHPSYPVLGMISIAVTLATTAAAVLEVLPPIAWIGLLVLGVGLGVLAVGIHLGEGRMSPEIDPVDQLKAQLAEVDAVRTWLNLREEPNEQLPLEEDRVFQWAKKTYGLLQKEFPAEADAFMGEIHAPLGSPYFATAYGLRTEHTGRSEYLETRANMIREIVRTH